MKYLVYYMFFAFAISALSIPFLSGFLSQEQLTERMFSLAEMVGGLYTTEKDNGKNLTDISLLVPSGFQISYFATGLAGPRVLAFDPVGRLAVSLTRSGEVGVFEEMGGSTGARAPKIILSRLSSPHGILFVPTSSGTWLYVAETNKVVRYNYNPRSIGVSNPKKILDLPSGGRHFTRTLLLLPDNRILVSIGSSCDTCVENDTRRAVTLVIRLDGSQVESYATGLRNTVFMRLHPTTHDVWGTEMGRDNLGDHLPPDEVNILHEGGFYGWPYCYGQRVVDKNFRFTETTSERCTTSEPSLIDIPAHSAPLGLAFIPENWPPGHRKNLLVAYHGSWNRSIPTGYKVVEIGFDSAGKYVGTKDFLSGWIRDGKVSGRPVDLLFSGMGVLYISDDDRGAIYQVVPAKPESGTREDTLYFSRTSTK